MSLSWHSRIIVGLAPDRLSALRVSGGWRPQILEQHDQPFDAANDPTSWDEAIEALGGLLAKPAWNKNTIEVVLTNHWAHYALVPGQKGLNKDEQQSLAKIVLDKAYGNLSRDWEIRISLGASDGTLIASGVPIALIEQLRTTCGARLVSIRPALMPIFNRARRIIGNADGYLALVEVGRVTLVSLKEGRLLLIASRAISPVADDALTRLLADMRMLQVDVVEGTLWICNLGIDGRLPSMNSLEGIGIEPSPIGELDTLHPRLAQWGSQ